MILLTNETNKDASLTANSTNTNYPTTNLLDSRLSRLFRTGASTTAEIVYDNVTAVNVTAVAIANHNITASATTIKIQGNATDVWTSPSVDETLTWDADIIYKTFTGGSYRYWRIQVIDATNSDGYIEMGRGWIGEYYTPPGIGPTVSEVRLSADVKSRSIGGQTYGDKRYNYSQFITQFPALTHTQKAEIKSFFDDLTFITPFFIDFNEDCSDLGTYYVTIDQEEVRFTTLSNPDYYTASINYLEEV